MDRGKLLIWLGVALGLGGVAYYAFAMGLFLPKPVDTALPPGTTGKKTYKINYITPWGSTDNPDYGFTEISVERIADFAIGTVIKTSNSRFPGPYAIEDIWDSGQGHGSLKINLPFTGSAIMQNAGILEIV